MRLLAVPRTAIGRPQTGLQSDERFERLANAPLQAITEFNEDLIYYKKNFEEKA